MHISYFKKMLIILRWSTKHAIFWLGVQYPLKIPVPYLNFFPLSWTLKKAQVLTFKTLNLSSNTYTRLNVYTFRELVKKRFYISMEIALVTGFDLKSVLGCIRLSNEPMLTVS